MKDTIIKEGPYRYDWKTREMVLIKGVTLEIGQLVTYHGYAMCTSKFVCISDPDSRGLQQLVEINGEHRRHTWDLSVNDRSTEQVFGIGLYYDPSPYRMPAEEIARHTRAADIQERWDARREANQKAADARECEQLRRQWAGILTPLADVEGWQEREKTEKANMLALLKHEYPGTRFSARKSRGGGYYTISWQDGPTEKAVEATCSVWHSYTFDCYTDYNEYTPSNFNKVFGGTEYRIDTNRTYSQPIQDAARADLLSICPEFADLLGTGELYRPEDAADIPQLWLNITVNRHPDNPTARAIEEAGWHAAAQFNQIRPDNILSAYLSTQDHTTTPDTPAGQKTDNPTDTTDNDQAPADGLQLVEIADGIAVTGDSRTTYRNRKAIKAHGAHWNKAAQQWQATTPEACAALRGWFAQNDTATDTTTTTAPQPLPEPPAAVIIDDTTDTTPAGQKTDTPTPTMQAELAANVKQHKTTLLDLRKKYELAKLGLDVFDQQAKEIYNKILSENVFTVSHDCPRMNLKPGDRITDEEDTFLMSEDDWQRYMKLTGPAMTAAGLTNEDGTYTTNWHSIKSAAKVELVNFLIDHIIPAALRSQFAKVRDSIIWQDKILATFESCIK